MNLKARAGGQYSLEKITIILHNAIQANILDLKQGKSVREIFSALLVHTNCKCKHIKEKIMTMVLTLCILQIPVIDKESIIFIISASKLK